MQPWRDWEIFLAARRAGSLVAAAKQLGVDAATVGRRLTLLEDALATKLFRRARDGLTVTAAGEALLDALAEVERGLYEVERRVAGHSSASSSVRISCSESIGTGLIAPAIGPFHAQRPQTKLHLLTNSKVAALLKREADIAVRMVQPTEDALLARRVGSLAFASTRHPAYSTAMVQCTTRPTFAIIPSSASKKS